MLSQLVSRMIEKRGAITFDQIMAELRAHHFAPVYILMGEETYFIDQIADYIANNALQEHERDFNQDIVFGIDTDVARIIDLARSFPLMSQRRVVIVKEAQQLKLNQDASAKLEKYMSKPVKSTILVICCKNKPIDRRKIFMKAAEMNGVVFESKKLKYDYDIENFIRGYLKPKGVTIDRKTAMMIVEKVGSDLCRTTSELDKVLIGLPQGTTNITPDIVEQQIGISKEYNIWELKSAVISHDVKKANAIVKYFNNNDKVGSVYNIVPTLFTFFQNLMLAHYAPEKNERSLATYLGLSSPWLARDYITGLRHYPGKKTMEIIGKLRQTDNRSKGLDNPNTSRADLLKELIFFILH